MAEEARQIRQGVYNNDYFSGAQVAIYIGDVLVDEITSFSYATVQNRTPLYGYASSLFDGVSKGTVLVQGEFSINFKEAGYLWLILNRYKALIKGQNAFHPADPKLNPGSTGEATVDRTIEQIVNGEQDTKPEFLKQISEVATRAAIASHASLAGFSSETRATRSGINGKSSLGQAEAVFEAFENQVWGKKRNTNRNINQVGPVDLAANRRADEPGLNPFDIYIAFGDFVDDDRIHHTVQKIADVHILGTSKQVVIDGQPIQEVYSFFAKDLI
jgi:hypothetical protein